jgi:hypothetical protein
MRGRWTPVLLATSLLVTGCQTANVRPEGAIEGAIFDELNGALGLVSGEPLAGDVEGQPPIPWVLEVGLPNIPRAVAVDPADLGTEADCVDPSASPSLPPIGLPTGQPGDPGDVVVPVVTQEITWELFESGGSLFEGDHYSVEQSPETAEEVTATFTTLPTIIPMGSNEAPRRFINVRIVLAAQLGEAPQLAACDVDDEVVVSGGLTLFLDELFNLAQPYVRELPIVLGLARHDDFQGGTLLLVPERMPFENRDPGTQEANELRNLVGPLFEELNTVQEQLDEIRGTVRGAGFLLNLLVGLDTLRNVVATTDARLTVVDEIPNMNVDDPEDGAPYQEAFSLCAGCGTLGNDIESEDAVSSLFLLGTGGERVSFYGDQHFASGEGHLSISVFPTGFFVAIRDLGFEDFVGPTLVRDPSDVGSLAGREAVGAGKTEVCRADEDRDWEDSFSSLRFFGPGC